MRNHRQNKRIPKTVVSIVVDGETEIWYLQLMKQHEILPKIDIKPEIPKKKSLKELYETVLDNAKHYDKVIWIVDFDTIIKESKEKRKGTVSALESFRNYKKKLQAKKYKNRVFILVNNPCLEFWHLLHFKNTNKYYSTCRDATIELKKYLPDYEKTQKYYKQKNNNIYQKLKAQQSVAVKNGVKCGEFTFTSATNAKAEIYRIFSILGISSINISTS